MSMKMGWRWYGEGNDPITLADIKQIPGVEEIVWALHSKMPGEIWEEDEIKAVVDQIHSYGFDATIVESVNVHDDIKIGLPTRDQYIENYKQCIRNLSKFGVKTICYNFMPVFDWTRTDLFHPIGDGSTALFYQKDLIKDDYKAMADYIMSFTEKYHMTFPGWEPERMAKLDELFKAYAPVTKEKLWDNLKYFLEAIMPTCHECDIKMAIHQDDPPWDIFGLPRLLVNAESIDRFLSMVDDPYNCLTLCSGSMNANPNNNVAAIVSRSPISATSITSRMAISARPHTAIAAARPASLRSCVPTMTAALMAASVLTTAVNCGRKVPVTAAPVTVSMTVPWVSSTCWVSGICSTAWTRRRRAKLSFLFLKEKEPKELSIKKQGMGRWPMPCFLFGVSSVPSLQRRNKSPAHAHTAP